MRQEQMLVEITSRKLLARGEAIEEGLPSAHLRLQLGWRNMPARQARVRGTRCAACDPIAEGLHLRFRQWRQPVGHTQLGRALRDERALVAVGWAELALADRILRLQGRMPGPETQQLYQQRAGRVGAAHYAEEVLGAAVRDAPAIDVEPGGGDAIESAAIVDVELVGAARQARIALQVELAGGIVATVAGDAAVVEDRLDAGRVVVARRSGLRIGASNADGQGNDHRSKHAIHEQTHHITHHQMSISHVRKASTPRRPRQVAPWRYNLLLRLTIKRRSSH